MEKLDLGNTFGKDHLSSALGVGTDAIGSIWTKLIEHKEMFRQSVLDNLAMIVGEDYLSRRLDKVSDKRQSELEQLAREHGISYNIVEPLVSYYRVNLEPVMPPPLIEPSTPIARPYVR